MIISKNTSAAKEFKEQPPSPLIGQICATPAAQLPVLLDSNLEWTSTTGDLYQWITVLNYFDDILESIIAKYGLDKEPTRLREFAPEDRAVTVSCLMFSKTLLDNCVNTTLYAGADRVYQLVDCATMDVKLAALEVALCLGKRYVNSSHVKDNAAPKDVRLKMLNIAKAFPPPVPAGFPKSSGSVASSHSSSDHYGLIDTLDQSQKCPVQWKALKFEYYCARAPEKDKRAKKDKKKQQKAEDGVLGFAMAEDHVRKLSLEQIFDKAAESVPPNFLLDFSYVALNAKAFNTDHHDAVALRTKLLRMKCLAIAFVCCMCSADFVSYQLFESEPYTLGFLMELISPENFGLISDDIFYTASRTISIISLKPVWGTEVLRHLGGSVSHGLLYQVLRFINKKVQSKDTNEQLEKGYSSFMSVLCNLAQYSTLASKLVAGGLLTELMSFLNIRSKHRWTCSIAVQIISILISDSVDMITKFAENNGFQLLIETVNYEVAFALENPSRDAQDSHQTITPKQARYIKKLLNFVTSLIQSDAGDRLRNLFDSSILQSFNTVIENPTVFGPAILSKVLYVVSEILHNEPTAYSILNEAQVVDKILKNYASLFMPYEEVVTALLEVLGALALNKDGLNKMIDLKVMPIFFRSFSDIRMVKELLRNDIWPTLGCTMEELGRHNPPLAPIIIEEVINLVQNFPADANKVSKPIQLFTSSQGNFYKSPQEELSLDEDGESAITAWDSSDGRCFFDAAIQFLDGVLHDASSWSKDIVKRVPYSSWEPMARMKNAPFDFTATRGSSHVSHLLRFLTEIDETYVLKDLLEDIGNQMRTAEIESFSSARIESSFFEDSGELANGSLQELNVLNNLLCVLCDTYVSPLITNKMYEILIDFLSRNDDLVEKLVILLEATIREDVHIRCKVPDEVFELTIPLRNHSSSGNDLFTIHAKAPPHKDPQQTHTSAKFKNTLQLRFLMDSLRVKLDALLACISVSCMHRRQDYFSDEWRRTAVINTKKLVVGLSGMFSNRFKLSGEVRSNFEFHSIKTISAVATTKDRGRDVLSTSTLSFFFHTTTLAAQIRECAVACLAELAKTSRAELSEYKELKFLHRALPSIRMKTLEICLWFFSRITLSSNVIRLPYTSFFYNKAYCENDNLVVDGILTLAGVQSFQLVNQTIGSSSFMTEANDYSIFNDLPRAISDLLVTIVRQTWSIEPIDIFYPLDENRMSPAYGEIAFLRDNFRISTEKAKDLLHASKSIQQLHELPVEALDDQLRPTWHQHVGVLNNRNLSREFEYLPVEHGLSSKFQSDLKEEANTLFPNALIKMAATTGWLQNNIAQTLKSNGLDVDMIDQILGQIRDYSKNKTDTNLMYLKNLYPLLEEFICHDPFVIRTKVHDSHQSTFLSTVDLFLSEMENYPELADTDYFAAGLSLMQPILSQTPPVVLSGVKPYFPNLTVSDEIRRRIANAVFKLEPKTNIKTSIVLAKYLYLLNLEGSFKEDVLKSPVLKSITGQMYHFMESEGKEEYKLLQNAVILVFRSVFEDRAIVEKIFSSEITKQFKRHSGRKREFRHFIDESRYLIGRDPNLFLDVAANMVRLDNYDGKSTFTKKVFLLEPEQQTSQQPSEDVEMADSSEPDSGACPSGIVNILLQQLMAVSKEDWTSSPPKSEKDEEPKKDKRSRVSEFEELSSNRKFGYMYFLLQSLCEIVGAYKEAKLEFITFSKKGTDERNKPRLTSLNFFIHQLIPSHSLAKLEESEMKRREAISSLAKLTLLSLVSTTIIKNDGEPDPRKEDPDMAIVRKLMMDIISKILKETSAETAPLAKTYSKLVDFFDLCLCLLSSKYRELCFPLLNVNATKFDQFYVASAFIDAQLPNQVSSVLAGLDLNFPEVSRVSNAGLKCLSSLAKTKLAHADLFENPNSAEKEEEDLEDLEERDDTPDLFRNSTLGMYDLEMEDMSVTDISEGDSESFDEMTDSELDSEDDDMDDMDDMDDEMGDYDHSEGDIEIIEDLDIQSGRDSEYGSEQDEFHGFDDDSEYSAEGEGHGDYDGPSDEEYYDEAELDGWLDAFADSDEHDAEVAEPSRFSERGRDADGQFHAVNSHSESSLASESDGEGAPGHEQHTIMYREPITSFLDAIRPFTQSIVTANPSGNIGGRIHIAGRGADEVYPQMNAALQALLNEGAPKNNAENMLIKSTTERWGTAFTYFFKPFESKMSEVARLQLTERISEASLDLFKKKADEKEKARKERAERIKKRQDEERKRREEEARQVGSEQSQTAHNGEPVMLWIGNREVDISGTDIDPEFFEALPEDMREEVFTQHVRERRAHANSFGNASREIDPDFLGALPEQIRDDILQQESIARRLSGGSVGFFGDEEDSENEFFDELGDEEFDFESSTNAPAEAEEPEVEKPKPKSQTFSVPLIDRSGVAGAVKLLFLPRAFKQREQIYKTLTQVTKNKQSRAEVLSMLVAILHDGLTSQKALEKLFYQLSAKAMPGKTPGKNTRSFPIGATPLVVGIQVIEALLYLLERNNACRLFLLTEHENNYLLNQYIKRVRLKKAGAYEDAYPINLLIGILEIPSLSEEHIFMDLLANVLNLSTRPLLILRDSKKQSPPGLGTNFVPAKNLRLVIKILTSNDCENATFRSTISAMHHLSLLKDSQQILTSELSETASQLGEWITRDLQTLVKELQAESKVDVYDSRIVNKFTSPSSDQSKLLRILTALDYMFESKKTDSDSHLDKLTVLYEKLELGTLWKALSDSLRVLEQNSSLSHFATSLLPSIEALMVVCKHSKVKELQNKDVTKYEARKIDYTKEPIENLFFTFTDEHKKILNSMVRSNPNLVNGPFSMLVKNSKVLEFDNKRNYFNSQLHTNKERGPKMPVTVRRDQVFLDSYRSLFFKSVEEFKKAHLEITFKGEAGLDAGGVSREWYQVLSRQMFNPDYALFTPVESHENTYHPNRTSYINPEHLSFFKFIGRIIGKAIYDGGFLDCHFSRAVYKNILDRPVSLKDMENLDLEYFKSLIWMLENDITDIITEDFSVETDDYGEHKTIDLVPNGRNIPVTQENKQEYVQLVTEYRLQTSVKEQMSNFIMGFHEVVPKELVAIFDEQELELLISGLPDIDVQDWQNNTTYNNYSASSEQIRWFWRAVKSFDNEERAKLLQFSTGTSKVPLNGFKGLKGANGVCKFSIHRDYGAKDRLPSSHTCFNQINLPAYETYETLRGALLLAVSEGHEGFQLA